MLKSKIYNPILKNIKALKEELFLKKTFVNLEVLNE